MSGSRIQPFGEFYASLKAAAHEQFKERPDTRVRSPGAFQEQKDHLVSLYDGVTAAHSFTDEGGQIFDCIPIADQPALKRSGRKLASPPTVPAGPAATAPELSTASAVSLSTDTRDGDGNMMASPPGTVPIRRLTLDELVRFETLGHFLRKHGHPRGFAGNALPLARPTQAEADPHQYAHAYQTANNFGGHGILSIWDPAVRDPQIFSLSQHWYSAQGPHGQTANPIVPVLGGGVQLTLQGQINEAGTFTVSATPSVGGTVTRQSQQQLMVPISFTSLRNLPELFAGQLLPSVQYLSIGVAGEAKKSADIEAARILKEIDELAELVEDAIKTYDAKTCPTTGGSHGPAVPQNPPRH